MNSQLDTQAALLDFVELYLADEQRDAPRELEAYLARFPGHEAAVRAEYERIRSDEQLPTPPGFEPGSALELPGPGDTLATYRIVRELGRGGQAVVYLAQDERLDRPVALKVLRARWDGATNRFAERLRREVRIVAGLDHPSLCTVYDAWLDHDPPCIAMRYVDGTSLARSLASQSPPVGPRDTAGLHRLLTLIETAARALHAAHETHVIHRDVKPGNIMVDRSGQPVVLDFGLARQTDADWAELTQDGEHFGTPAYMSPEQILDDPVDRRTDVFSLGVTLFECLTLSKPFAGRGRSALEQSICTADMPGPKRLNSVVPRDLVVVLETALAKKPERRYLTALAFADDLRRIRRYEPIQARPVGRMTRLARWCQRKPALATTVLALFLSLIAGLGISLSILADERLALRGLEARQLAHEAAGAVAKSPARALLMAVRSLELEPTHQASTALMKALVACDLETALHRKGDTLVNVDFGPEGRLLAMAYASGDWSLWDIQTRTERTPRGSAARNATVVRFDPGGRRLAIGTREGQLMMVDLQTERASLLFTGKQPFVGLRFTPDGGRLITTSAQGRVRLHDIDGRSSVLLGQDASATRLVDVSPTGRFAVTLTDQSLPSSPDSRRALLWDLTATGAAPRPLEGHTDRVRWARFSPDGALLATASEDGTARLWDVETGAEQHRLEHPDRVCRLVFSRDGETLVTTYDPGDPLGIDVSGVTIWDVRSGEALRSLAGHEGRLVASAVQEPAGSRFATTGYDGTVRVWDMTNGRLLRTLREGLPQLLDRVHWTADGQRLAAWNRNGVFIWFLGDRETVDLEGHKGAVLDIAFSPSGDQLLTASADGTAGVWDRADGRRRITYAGHAGRVTRIAFHPREALAASASDDGTARLWNTRSGATQAQLDSDGAPITALSFDPHGERLLTASNRGTAWLWDGRSGQLIATLNGHRGAIRAAAFSPDGRHLATGAADKTCRLWDAHTGAHIATLGGWDAEQENPRWVEVFEVLWDGPHKLLAICEDGLVRVWTLADGAPRLETAVKTYTLGALFPLADGTWLGVRRWAASVIVVDPQTLQRRSGIDAHSSLITDSDLSPDGRWLLTCALDGTATLFAVPSLERSMNLLGHRGYIASGCFSPDGATLATAGEDGRVRLRPVDPLRAARRRLPIHLDAGARR